MGLDDQGRIIPAAGQPGAERQGKGYHGRGSKAAALLVATVGSFLMPFMGSSINVALPAIGTEFALSAVGLSWIATSYLLATAMFLVPLGRLADLYGRNRLYIVGMTIYTVASFLCAVSPGAGLLIGSRVLQGIGSSMMVGTSMALVTAAFPVGERGRALGLTVAATYLGLSLGPFFGGLLTQHLGWRSLFWANVPLGGFVAALALAMLGRDEPRDGRERFDLTGSVVYSASLLAMMLGLSELRTPAGPLLLGTGLVGLLLFAVWESRVPFPVLDLTFLRSNRVFLFSSLAALINYSATYAVGFLLSLYLQYVQGFDPQQAGLVLVAQPVIMTLFSPLAGRLSDRVEPRLVATLGMGLTVVGLLLLACFGKHTPLLAIIASLAVLGLGFAFFSSPNTNAVMSTVERRFFGVASGVLATMRLTGQMLSMAVAMLVLALTLGKATVTPELYPQFLVSARIIFLLLAGLCFGGVFASLARGKVR